MKASDNVFPKVEFSEGAAPATPAAGEVRIYAKTDGLMYSKDDAGAETALGGASDFTGLADVPASYAGEGGKVVAVKMAEDGLEFVAGGGGGAVVGAQIGYAYTASTTPASTTATIPSDNTAPQNTEGAAYASADTTYTPTSATSLLEVEVEIPLVSANSGAAIMFALFRDSGADAIATSRVNIHAANYNLNATVRVVVPATAASATTFKLRWGVSGSTGYLLRDNAQANYFNGKLALTMTVKEIKQ